MNIQNQEFDSVDSAYIFDGLRIYREKRRGSFPTFRFSYMGEGELEDFSFMFNRSIEAAIAISQLVEPVEFERMGVFCYEHLNEGDPLIQSLAIRHKEPALQVVRDWCVENEVQLRMN